MISVIIPSYNRAHILPRTIPTYCDNDLVHEVIVVNDCSSDNTVEVLDELSKKYSKIKYISLTINQKQAAAKNHGIHIATGEYIYFADDDSFLLPKTIDKLYATLNGYDIMGVRALYCKDENDVLNLEQFIQRQNLIDGEFFNYNTLEMNYQMKLDKIQSVIFCHACFMIRASDARNIMFDPNYLGNGYREETDFLIRARHMGLTIGYNTELAQINLPRNIATGGAHSENKLKFYMSMLRNNYYFLVKNQDAIRDLFNFKSPVIVWQIRFILSRVLGKIYKKIVRT